MTRPITRSVALLTIAPLVLAATLASSQPQTAPASATASVTLSPAEHAARAREYAAQAQDLRKKAQQHRGEAGMHRVTNDKRGPAAHLSMAQHCDDLAKSFEAAAKSSDALAELHRKLADERP